MSLLLVVVTVVIVMAVAVDADQAVDTVVRRCDDTPTATARNTHVKHYCLPSHPTLKALQVTLDKQRNGTPATTSTATQH